MDKFLSNAIQYSNGIRILKQDLWETIISFIISQRKSIPAIKTCIEKLCNKYGNKIICKGFDKEVIAYDFPTAETLYSLSIEELKKCGLGYRAEYIKYASEWWFNYASY